MVSFLPATGRSDAGGQVLHGVLLEHLTHEDSPVFSKRTNPVSSRARNAATALVRTAIQQPLPTPMRADGPRGIPAGSWPTLSARARPTDEPFRVEQVEHALDLAR